MEARVSCSVYNSAFSFVDYVSANSEQALRNKAKDVVRQCGHCGHDGFKGITIKLAIEETGNEITFNPR